MHWYWLQTSGNILAIPPELVITALITIAVCRPVTRLWRRMVPVHPSLRHALEAAEAAHRIAADTHEHLTGQRHPDAPKADHEGQAL